MIRGAFWKNIFLIPCLVLDLWRHLWHYFALISLILLLHCLFNIFTLFLENVYHGSSYLKWSEENFGKMSFWYHVSFWTYDVISDAFIYLLSSFTWFLENVYHGSSYLTRSEEQFGTMFFWYHVSFLPYDGILLYFTNFTSSSPFWAT